MFSDDFHPPAPAFSRRFALAVARIRESLSPATEAEAAIVADQIKLTRGTSNFTDAILPVAAGLIAFACRNWAKPLLLLGWVGIIAAICVIMHVASRRLDPLLEGDVASVRRAARIRTALTAGLLLAWSAIGILFWVPGDAVNNMFVTLVLACSLAATASMLAAHPASVAIALLTNGGVLVMRPALAGSGALDWTLAGLGLVFCGLMASQVRVVHRMARHARELEFDRHRVLADLKRAKAESDRDRARAVTAGRTRSEFLANMSHELRTPLNAVLGFSEIIKSKSFGDDLERYRHYGGIIHESGAHLLQLIDDMLDLARIEGGRMTLDESVFALGGVVREIADSHHAKAERAELTLRTEIDPHLPAIEADERAIRTIFANLLSNALKFTPGGGEIILSARLDADGRIALAVEDTGIGIAPEDQLVVFERFGLRRHDIAIAGEGTGLGLAVVKGFAQAHDGEVALESELGVGTRVIVLLPAWRTRETREGLRGTG